MRRYANLLPAVVLVWMATSMPKTALAQITAINTRALTWERSDTPGLPEGARRKVLKIDHATGIGAALRWHPRGYVEPRHYHTSAAHSIYVLEGTLEVGGVEAGPGHFFHFPASTAHGPLVALEDSVFLIWTEGPLDLELGDPPHGEAPGPGGVQ
ncbi:MAG TPA: cupin domain-containing protein [Gemmatimonadaceae bacterium]|nr:cupin domain-containing protein [Gemmatimonadaceae bacterium]